MGDGVHVGNGRARQLHAQSAEDSAVGVAATAPAAAAVYGSGASQDAQGSRGGPGRDAGGDVAQQLAGAGALEIGQRELGCIAGTLDVKIVFEGQGDGVAQGNTVLSATV